MYYFFRCESAAAALLLLFTDSLSFGWPESIHCCWFRYTKKKKKNKREWMNRRGREKKMNEPNKYECKWNQFAIFSHCRLYLRIIAATPVQWCICIVYANTRRNQGKAETRNGIFCFVLTGKIFKRKCCHLQTNHHFVHMPICPTQQQCHWNEGRFNQ